MTGCRSLIKRLGHDFKEFAEADQEWFRLLTEQVVINGQVQNSTDPTKDIDAWEAPDPLEMVQPGAVDIEELTLISEDWLKDALAMLIESGTSHQSNTKRLCVCTSPST